MDELSFIAKIVQAVVWPIFLVIILLVFRRPIVSLLSGAKIRYKDLEMQLSVAEISWGKTQPLLANLPVPPAGSPQAAGGRNAENRGDDESNGS
jgi:hypothetical protein